MVDGTDLPAARFVIVGQGYVGLPVAMRAVEVGFDVVGFDVDEAKVAGLVAGRSHIDDITDADVRAALATGRYLPSTHDEDLAGFDVAVITVPTPLRDRVPDLSHVEAAGRQLSANLRAGATVVLESTSYPGTTEELLAPILEAGSGLVAGTDFQLGYSPERIDPGNPTWNFRTTPKVVSGVDERSLKVIDEFYSRLVDITVPVSGTREAEMTKLLENTFRHVNVALVNELAIHARTLGADIWEVVRAASTKPFGFMAFQPGPGVGGHCLPVDPSYLSWKIEQNSGESSRFIDTANQINHQMPKVVVERVMHALNRRGLSTHGARVLVLGVAYKKNSGDGRETPALGVVKGLLEFGAHVVLHDTLVERFQYDGVAPRVDLNARELAAADIVVLLTDHDHVDYERVGRHASFILDTRHRLSGDNVEYL